MEQPKRQGPILGDLEGQRIEIDPDWWKPMTDEEANEFLGISSAATPDSTEVS
jgi:hypothetical protein